MSHKKSRAERDEAARQRIRLERKRKEAEREGKDALALRFGDEMSPKEVKQARKHRIKKPIVVRQVEVPFPKLEPPRPKVKKVYMPSAAQRTKEEDTEVVKETPQMATAPESTKQAVLEGLQTGVLKGGGTVRPPLSQEERAERFAQEREDRKTRAVAEEVTARVVPAETKRQELKNNPELMKIILIFSDRDKAGKINQKWGHSQVYPRLNEFTDRMDFYVYIPWTEARNKQEALNSFRMRRDLVESDWLAISVADKEYGKKATTYLWKVRDRELAREYLLPELACKQIFGLNKGGERTYKSGAVHLPFLGETVKKIVVPLPGDMDRRASGMIPQDPWKVFHRSYRNMLLLREPTFSQVSPGKVTLFYGKDEGWLKGLEGWQFKDCDKFQKRAKALVSHFPFVLEAAGLTIQVLSVLDTEIVGEEKLRELGLPEDSEASPDGIFVMDKDHLHESVRQSLMRSVPEWTQGDKKARVQFLAEKYKDLSQEEVERLAEAQLRLGLTRSQENFVRYVKHAGQHVLTYTARIFIPRGTPGCAEGGLLKGVVLFERGLKLRTGYDIITSRKNIKKEIMPPGDGKWQMGFVPQERKDKEACMSIQAILAHPFFLTEEFIGACMMRALWKALYEIKAGEMDEEIAFAHEQTLALEKELDATEGEEAPNNFIDRTIWNAARWKGAGLGVLNSPTLAERLLTSKTGSIVFDTEVGDNVLFKKEYLDLVNPTAEQAKALRIWDMKGRHQLKLNFPMPCSFSEQIVSYALYTHLLQLPPERMPFGEPGMGVIRRDRKRKLSVVSCEQWLEMLESHGGCDQDDKFVLVLVNDRGVLKVMVWRSPTDRGEYSIFLPHEDDLKAGLYRPAELYKEGGVKKDNTLAAVKVDFSTLPTRLGEAIRSKQVTITGLTDTNGGKKKKAEPKDYTLQGSVDAAHLQAFCQGPGIVMNALMLLNSSSKNRSPEGKILGTSEKIIDLAVQLKDMDQVRKFKEYGTERIEKALTMTGWKADRVLWLYKNFQSPDKDRQPELVDGILTRLRKKWYEKKTLVEQLAADWVEKNKVLPLSELKAYELRETEAYAWWLKRLGEFRKNKGILLSREDIGKKEKDAEMLKLDEELVAELRARGGHKDDVLALYMAAWDRPRTKSHPMEKEVWIQGIFDLAVEALKQEPESPESVTIEDDTPPEAEEDVLPSGTTVFRKTKASGPATEGVLPDKRLSPLECIQACEEHINAWEECVSMDEEGELTPQGQTRVTVVRKKWQAVLDQRSRKAGPVGDTARKEEEETKEVTVSEVNLSQANISAAQKRHLAKDQYKSDQATVLLAAEGSSGATGEYLHLWKEAGRRVNAPQEGDVCFVSANGKRSGAKEPPVELIRQAAELGCTFLTDARSRRPEGGNAYNTGEQRVAELLRSLGYTESEECGGLVCRWSPAVKAKEVCVSKWERHFRPEVKELVKERLTRVLLPALKKKIWLALTRKPLAPGADKQEIEATYRAYHNYVVTGMRDGYDFFMEVEEERAEAMKPLFSVLSGTEKDVMSETEQELVYEPAIKAAREWLNKQARPVCVQSEWQTMWFEDDTDYIWPEDDTACSYGLIVDEKKAESTLKWLHAQGVRPEVNGLYDSCCDMDEYTRGLVKWWFRKDRTPAAALALLQARFPEGPEQYARAMSKMAKHPDVREFEDSGFLELRIKRLAEVAGNKVTV